jgi:hypothetical protein
MESNFSETNSIVVIIIIKVMLKLNTESFHVTLIIEMELVFENWIVQLTRRGRLPKKILGISSWLSLDTMVNRLVWTPVNHQWRSAKLNISAVKSHAQVAQLTARGPVTW